MLILHRPHQGGSRVRCTRRSVIFRYRSAQHYLEHFRAYFGPTIRAFEGLAAEEQERLSRAVLDNVQRFNVQGSGPAPALGALLDSQRARKGTSCSSPTQCVMRDTHPGGFQPERMTISGTGQCIRLNNERSCSTGPDEVRKRKSGGGVRQRRRHRMRRSRAVIV